MKESSTTSLDLNGLHLPELPSWFPLAWGWWASLAGILIVMLIIGLAVRWHRRRLAPKKTRITPFEFDSDSANALFCY